MNSKTLAIFLGFALIAGLAVAPEARADTIAFDIGTIGLSGQWTSDSGDVQNATRVIIESNLAEVALLSGSFADYLSVGDLIQYNDISFAQFQPFQLWSGGGFTFTLTSLEIVRQDKNQLRLAGIGELALSDGTLVRNGVSWEFRGLKNGNFQNDAVVPEPSSLVLLSVGLISLSLAARRFSRTAA